MSVDFEVYIEMIPNNPLHLYMGIICEITSRTVSYLWFVENGEIP